MKCPCKECSKREVGCHGKCANYQEWRKWRDEQNAKERAIRNAGYSDSVWMEQHWKKVRKKL